MSRIRSVVIVNHYAGGPDIGSGWRHYELARRWSAAGVATTIVTASTAIGGDQGPSRTRDREVDGVFFRFVPCRSYRGNAAPRLLNMLDFVRGCRRALGTHTRERGRPSAIVASSPQPFAWGPSRAAARAAEAMFVPEVRDLWPESLVDIGGVSRIHPLVLACRAVRGRAMREADLVFSPLAHFHRHAEAFGLANARCIHVPNGVTISHEHGDPRQAGTPDGRRRLLYAGAMGLPNALEDLIAATGRLSPDERSRISVVMVGDGTQRARLEASAKSECPGVFAFLGSLPQPDTEALARTCNAAVIAWKPHPLYRFGTSPQKVPFYLACGLPVIAASPDEDDPVRTQQLGWWSPAGDISGLARSLRQFIVADAATLRTTAQRCRDHARRALDWDTIATRALDALEMRAATRLAAVPSP